MKKIYLFAVLLIFSLFLAQCSSDDSNDRVDGTLFVNGESFALGTNNEGDIHNSTTAYGTEGFYVNTFTITKNAQNVANTDVITITIINDQQNSVNGTYSFFNEGDENVPDNYAVGDYTVLATNISYGNGQTTGTVKVTKISTDVFKLEFNDVSMKLSGSTDAKTITGYCELEFYRLPQ